MSDSIPSEARRSSSNSLNLEQLQLKITNLNQELEKVKQEKADLEIMLEAMTQHADVVEEELYEEAEAARRESEEHFRLMAEATPVTVLISHPADSKVLYANAAASFLFGLPIEELLGRSMLDFYASPDDCQKLIDIYTKNGSLRNYEICFKTANETVFWGAFSIQPFFLNGEEVLLGAILDVTKRKQSEVDRIRFTQALKEKHAQLQRLSVLKDEFLINTSNELCTPLDGMVDIIQSLLEAETGELSQEQRQKLLIVAQSGHKLLSLVNNIRDFSKLRQGDIELQLQPVNLRSLAEVVLQLSQTLIGEKDLQLVNAIPADLPTVYADERCLHQILRNLVDNAIKFTECGSVEISAAVGEFQENGKANQDQIAITVADTGSGIAEAELEGICELFKQADHLVSGQSETKDLKLSITKALVELHGGKIWVESAVGFGTRFTFTLPASASVASAASTPEIVPNPSPIQLSTLSVTQPGTPTVATPTVTVTDAASSSGAIEERSAQTTVASVAKTPPTQQHPQSKLMRVLGRVPLRVILIVPFVVQVIGAVGLVGYLSFRNGQQTVNDISSQLRREVVARVQVQLRSYL